MMVWARRGGLHMRSPADRFASSCCTFAAFPVASPVEPCVLQIADGVMRRRVSIRSAPRFGDVTPFNRSVAGVLDSLDLGDVVTYGEVAAEAGYPGAARAVGSFLARHGSDHPWWRVVTATGRLLPGREREHAALLAAEGVAIVGGRVAACAQPAHSGKQARSVSRLGR